MLGASALRGPSYAAMLVLVARSAENNAQNRAGQGVTRAVRVIHAEFKDAQHPLWLPPKGTTLKNWGLNSCAVVL